jgi:hypothetical protein
VPEWTRSFRGGYFLNAAKVPSVPSSG